MKARQRQNTWFGVICLTLALAGCGGTAAAPPPPTTPPTPAAAPPAVQMIITSTDLAIGRNRFTLGFLYKNHPVETGHPKLDFYFLGGAKPTFVERTTAWFNRFAAGLPHNALNAAATQIGGVFVSYPSFRAAGAWGVQAHIRVNGQVQLQSQTFDVRSRSLTPAIGSPAPRTNNPTIAQLPVSRLDSGHPPDDMHRLSIAQAIAQHKPLVIVFSTPAFCTSRMCGPVTTIVEQAEKQYRGRVNFIHVEAYKDANPAHGYAPAMLQWHLPTEPWVFVIDRRGVVRAKFEGPTSLPEIDAAVRAVLVA